MNASKFGDKNSESIDREAVLTADRHTISFDDKFCTQIIKRSLYKFKFKLYVHTYAVCSHFL